MAKTKQQTDIEIAKALVKKQKEAREDNFQEFRERQETYKKKKTDWQKRLQDNKYI